MEEFRTIIADTLTLSLFNLKILQQDDFYTERLETQEIETSVEEDMPDVTKDPIGWISGNETDSELFDLPEQRMNNNVHVSQPSTGKRPIKLYHEAFRRVIEAFEKKLTTSFYHAPAGRKLTYEDVIIFQAGHYRKVIEGEAEEYQPVLLK
jgi:CRISPR-associated protein Cas1